MNRPVIYLDNNATTQLDPEVLAVMTPFQLGKYGNPSSPYTLARDSAAALLTAREQVAALINSRPEEIVFTGGGTEGNNTAIHSAIESYPERRHVVMTQVEHPSVLQYGRHLEKHGYRITYLPLDKAGRLDMDALRTSLMPDTAIVSVMTANNETGVLFPIMEIGEMVRGQKILFHTDAVQAAGKFPVNVSEWSVDYLTLGGHKMHASKGTGALYVRRGSPFHPLLVGGDQESGRRAGTENVAGIAGLGKASALALAHLGTMDKTIRKLRNTLEEMIVSRITGVRVIAQGSPRLPNTSSMLIQDVDSDTLLARLDMAGLCCSSGSACASGAHETSHVLRAMGVPASDARGVLRVSLSRFNTPEDIDVLGDQLASIVMDLRRPSRALPRC